MTILPTHTHTHRGDDTAAISYQSSRPTAAEKQTDGKEQRRAINKKEGEETE